MSYCLQVHGLLPSTRLLCPWNFPGENTGVCWHFLLQGIFPAQGLNLHLLHLLHWQADFFLPLATWKSLKVLVAKSCPISSFLAIIVRFTGRNQYIVKSWYLLFTLKQRCGEKQLKIFDDLPSVDMNLLAPCFLFNFFSPKNMFLTYVKYCLYTSQTIEIRSLKLHKPMREVFSNLYNC